MNIKISIVVPVYNAEKYLCDCLDSLSEQDLAEEDYEIVCVNDGSKDASAEILEKHAEKHGNVVVIHQENAGVSSARNTGMAHARGEYVWFVDSDDCIRKNCLGEIAGILEQKKPYVLRFGYERVNDEELEARRHEEPPSYGWETVTLSHINSVCTSVFCLKTIREKNLTFRSDIKYGEDSLFWAYIFLYRDDDLSISTKTSLYLYRQHEASAMHDTNVGKTVRHSEDLLKRAALFRLERENPAFSRDIKFLKRMQYSATFGYLTLLPMTGKAVEEALEKLKRERLYPFPCFFFAAKRVKGLKGKIKNVYRAVYYRFPCLYKRYYQRNKRRHT